MRKAGPRELTRDSASDAFRYWALVEDAIERLMRSDETLREAFGKIPYMVERYKLFLTLDIVAPLKDGARAGIGKPTEAAQRRIEDRLENAASQIHNMEAVQKVFDWLGAIDDGPDIMRALQAVYMTNPGVGLNHTLIGGRVWDMARDEAPSPDHILSYKTAIYRRLKKARFRWGLERGAVVTEATEIY
jgi:hypothetical protein